jgi:predicted nucleic acid-binding protein
MDLIADTSLLIGLWRGQPWATSFAQTHASSRLGIPWIVLGEFWHGATRAGHDASRVKDFLSIGIPLLETEKVIPIYAQLCAKLQDTPDYRGIGQNDLWIAAVSIAYARPLVTRNARHFSSIEGLQLLVVGE